MAVKTYGIPLYFGIPGEYPEVPQGWTFRASAKDFLVAINTNDDEFFVSQTHAHPKEKSQNKLCGSPIPWDQINEK